MVPLCWHLHYLLWLRAASSWSTGGRHERREVGKRITARNRISRMKTLSCATAVQMIPDGATLMIGGFMGVGTPERLIDELVRQGKRNLIVIANDNAVPGAGNRQAC
jgi:hypothetical protein